MENSRQISVERVRLEIQSRFNPIRGLTPERLSRALEEFKIGNLRQAAILWEAMEDRDPFIKSVVSKRKKDVARNGWEILTVDDSPEALRHKEALEFCYNNVTCTHALEQNQRGGASLLFRQMMDAKCKRFAVHESVWKPKDGRLTADFVFCPLWFFENRTGRLRFLRDAFGLEGEEMREHEWLVTVGEGLMESTSVAYVFKHLSLKDWVNFTEKFGLPALMAMTDEPEGSDTWNRLVEALRNFGQDFGIVCNTGSTITPLEIRTSGEGPYLPLVNYCDKVIATVWRGGDLSTISQGGDSVGASLQGDESAMLLEDDTQWLSETLNTQVDRFVIQYLFGTEPLAYIKIGTPQKKDIQLDLQVDQFLLNAGAPLSVQDRMEHYGRAIPEGEEPLLRAAARPALPEGNNPALANESEFRARSLPLLAQAVAQDLTPVRKRLREILALANHDERTRALAEFKEKLAGMAGNAPASTRAMELILSTSLFNGMENPNNETNI